MQRSIAHVALGALALLACSGSSEDRCSPEAQKQDVLAIARSWYLYPELLPAQVDLSAHAGPADLLDALTAEAQLQRKDRGWSFVTTLAQTQTFYEEGTSVGFGFGVLDRGSRLFVSQVFPGSAAADAAFARGDEILAIGETAAALVPAGTLLATGGLGAALGPSEPGVTRTFEVVPVGSTNPEIRVASKRIFSLDPVPEWRVVSRAGQPPLGYVSLRTFIQPAEAGLLQAFEEFHAAGVSDVVVDLRYNGGGLVSTAMVLADLLGGGLDGEVMFSVRNSPLQVSLDGGVAFAPVSASVAPFRIAFVTTGASASASELVPNSLEPFVSVALVGERTYGKPVGQRGFVIGGCGTVVYLVSFKLVNAQEEGDYFDGLPDAAGAFSGPLCEAEDRLDLPQSDPLEPSTAAALHFLETGSCPAPPVGPMSSPAAADAYPEPLEPTFAQRHVRGLF